MRLPTADCICISGFWGLCPQTSPGLCLWTPLGTSVPQTPCAHPTSKPWLRHCRLTPRDIKNKKTKRRYNGDCHKYATVRLISQFGTKHTTHTPSIAATGFILLRTRQGAPSAWKAAGRDFPAEHPAAIRVPTTPSPGSAIIRPVAFHFHPPYW